VGKVRWTPEAELWLRDIHDYIAADSPAAAQRTVRQIYEKAGLLASYPEAGYAYEARGGESVRILLQGHYRIAYRIKAGEDVDILGVFHGALDIDRFLW
jgi:plasmid stabilization system protein ParE